MFAEFIAEQARPFFDYLKLAVDTTFRPIKVAHQIKLGDREDFKYRLTFFLAICALWISLQTFAAAYLDVDVMPARIDTFWQYLQPILAGSMFLLLYLPMRILRWTRLKFSEYFQAAAMSMGPGLFQQPFILLPAFLVVGIYGHPNANDPAIEGILNQPGAEALSLCAPDFSSLMCLNSFGSVAPETAWTGDFILLINLIFLVPVVMLIKHATGIAYWKQAASFAIILMVIAGVGLAIENLYT
ncbi:hypothetical protein SAMN04488061_0186 [Filomicrobium insigne]|uniref:Yip1 domain-containing protein n=1 Tax=Filomicrobium insigne TaxID=418854 RepID=A0A1H0GKY6_9HYPH|nr:hypothetical protein [Filomicrobium insigne]SDO07361.1 hypothetical protein SAMN04488061_0186 [Filomicrobium insigne]